MLDAPVSRISPPHAGTAADWKRWVEALPLAATFGFECVDIDPGRIKLRFAAAPVPLNPNGSVHGGVLAAAADECMGIVAITALPPGSLPATASLHVDYHSPAFPPLTLLGRVDRAGRTLVFVDVDIEDRDGRVCTRCRGTMAPLGAIPKEGSS
jgi:uncharacterized protein (TIGR00369 family)